jgi:hypothetical protein
MSKKVFMVVALASVLGLGTACFGLFKSSDRPSTEPSCDGLSGQARVDCENAQKK